LISWAVGAEYIDLVDNPERYTGYTGPPANNIWSAIYQENCFDVNQLIVEKCLEKDFFYRIISGTPMFCGFTTIRSVAISLLEKGNVDYLELVKLTQLFHF
jgi:hypothetical protein